MYIDHLKSIIATIASSFLGTLVLLSSFGFTVSTHLCGGEKIKSEVGFVKVELTCGMKMDTSRCPQKNEIHTVCCQNIFDYYHMEDHVKKEKVEILNLEIDPTFYPLIIRRPIAVRDVTTFNTAFLPPIRVKGFAVVYQTFLI
ncbi:MAG: hypothetical protein ACI85Q_002540 [Salibacteraceae bacterium]